MPDRMETNDLMDEVFNRYFGSSFSMDDSDRNIMRSMRHEPCDTHCEDCGACIGKDAEQYGLDKYRDLPVIVIGEHDYCEDCADYVRENYPREGWEASQL